MARSKPRSAKAHLSPQSHPGGGAQAPSSLHPLRARLPQIWMPMAPVNLKHRTAKRPPALVAGGAGVGVEVVAVGGVRLQTETAPHRGGG